MADGLEAPAGVCVAEGGTVLYVCDRGPGRATVYAFDVVYPRASGYGCGAEDDDAPPQQPFLANRRVFAFVPVGVPDGICGDRFGNVWVDVWDRGGRLIGKVLVEGGVKGCCWEEDGELWVSGGDKL